MSITLATLVATTLADHPEPPYGAPNYTRRIDLREAVKSALATHDASPVADRARRLSALHEAIAMLTTEGT